MQIENPIATTENCRYCLMCRHTCPVGHVMQKETLTPHGWGLTIASVKRDLLTWNEDSVDVLYSCADCGSCRSHCVTDQPLPDAIAAARAKVVEQNLAPPAVYEVNQALQEWGNPFVKKSPEQVTQRGDVALFVGDDASYAWPSALEAVLTLLRAVGVEPVLVGVGRNNGYLASSLGLQNTAETLARANLEEITATGAGQLLLLTPGDYYTFSQLYDERLGITLPKELELLEVIQFLSDQFEAGKLLFKTSTNDSPYAYVDPTHTVRVDGRFHAPRRLLAAITTTKNLNMFWREDRAHPCGNTALQFTQPLISNHLTYARLGDALDKGAKRVITEDPGCLAQLNRHAPRFGVQVQGLYELLAENLMNEE
jgi:Fe-S oxidoreductase